MVNVSFWDDLWCLGDFRILTQPDGRAEQPKGPDRGCCGYKTVVEYVL